MPFDKAHLPLDVVLLICFFLLLLLLLLVVWNKDAGNLCSARGVSVLEIIVYIATPLPQL